MKSVYHIPKRDLGGFTVTGVNVFFHGLCNYGFYSKVHGFFFFFFFGFGE